MKFSCNVSVLKSALDLVGRVPTSKYNPFLINVKMQLKGDSLEVTKTDLVIAIASIIPVDGSDEGGFCIPYDFLKQITMKVDRAHDLTLEVDNDFNVTITWAKGKFQHKALSVDDFPTFPEVNGAEYVFPSTIMDHLSFSSRYVSRDETKQILTGVNLSVKDGTLHSVATDGHRLGVSSGELKLDPFNVTIPGSTIAILKAAVDGDIRVKLDDSQILFQTGDTRIASRLLEGNFPDALQLIPPEFKYEITMNGTELKSALDRVAIACDDKKLIELQFGTGILSQVQSLSFNGDTGNASEGITASIITEPFQVTLHYPYLVSALPDGEFILQANSNNRPIVVRDGDRIALIMPVASRF